jgi:hypothetical protein
VTKWSKFDTHWKGVSVDTLLESVGTEAEYVTAFSDGGPGVERPRSSPGRAEALGPDNSSR